MIIKEFREFLKERRQYKVDTRRLEQLTLDYEALKRIVQAVETSNVTIAIELKDGAKMVISKQAANQIPFKSFAELYSQAADKGSELYAQAINKGATW